MLMRRNYEGEGQNGNVAQRNEIAISNPEKRNRVRLGREKSCFLVGEGSHVLKKKEMEARR